MAHLRVVDLAKPFLVVTPEVSRPYQKVDVGERLVWVVGTGIVYAVLSELPLYGAQNTMSVPDPVSWLSYVLASSPGTPLELGVFPLLLSAFSLQLLAGVRAIRVSLDLRSDRVLFQSVQKLLAIFITVAFSVLIVLSGTYGDVTALGLRSVVFLILQLVGGGLCLILLDEVIQKGYGIATGILIFSTLKATQRFLWDAMSLQVVQTSRGPQYYGALPNIASDFWSRSPSFAFINGVFRPELPNLLQVLGAVVAFGVFVYLSAIRYNIPIRSTRMRGASNVFPLRIIYTNAMPLLFWAASLAPLDLLSASLYNLWPSNLAVRLLGTWAVHDDTLVAISGLAYYLSPPADLGNAIWDPVRTLVFSTFTITVCTVFARVWTASSGFAPADLANQFKENGLVIVGRREGSVLKELKRTVPLAATLGGAVTGFVVAAFSIFGLGSWAATLGVGVFNLLNVFEQLGEEDVNPQALLGDVFRR